MNTANYNSIIIYLNEYFTWASAGHLLVLSTATFNMIIVFHSAHHIFCLFDISLFFLHHKITHSHTFACVCGRMTNKMKFTKFFIILWDLIAFFLFAYVSCVDNFFSNLSSAQFYYYFVNKNFIRKSIAKQKLHLNNLLSVKRVLYWMCINIRIKDHIHFPKLWKIYKKKNKLQKGWRKAITLERTKQTPEKSEKFQRAGRNIPLRLLLQGKVVLHCSRKSVLNSFMTTDYRTSGLNFLKI